jgi:maltooligosyltrehalose trehalohydrolase
MTYSTDSATAVGWQPRLGAYPDAGAVTFQVWAPMRRQVELILRPGLPSSQRRSLTPTDNGLFTGAFADVSPGDLYAYLLDGEGPFPDPVSRFQPQGVHGPSAVVDPRAFAWSDDGWRSVPLQQAVVYELHVGTFTEAGTFAAVTDRLPYLADLGVTVLELMPIADFPGSRNWGYDGVSLFAPSRAYGAPDDLRRLVDTAHRRGLAVVLDVVYNHFGPDGAYGSVFSPFYLSTRHRSPWGAAVNLDGKGSEQVREFFIENALYWLHEYHFDGLRLDATHGLIDDSSRHFVAELAARVRASLPHRRVLLIAEDERNLATIVRSPEDGGWGLDAVWADDFHHQARCLAAGDRDGYYEDFTGTIADLVTTIRQGWFYHGQFSAHRGERRGTDPSGVPLCRMVYCLQNHDQIGNRPFGGRLNHQIEPALFRALSALLLFLPETPLLFMGQEWAASTRFLFFTDHHVELGRLVTKGRREEFSRFDAFADPVTRTRIPDPQASSTFEDSRLVWNERMQAPHAGVLELYRALLRLRRTEPALQHSDDFDVMAFDDASLAVLRASERDAWLLVLSTGTSCLVDLRQWRSVPPNRKWEIVLTTDDARFLESDGSPQISGVAINTEDGLSVRFSRPASVILRGHESS